MPTSRMVLMLSGLVVAGGLVALRCSTDPSSTPAAKDDGKGSASGDGSDTASGSGTGSKGSKGAKDSGSPAATASGKGSVEAPEVAPDAPPDPTPPADGGSASAEDDDDEVASGSGSPATPTVCAVNTAVETVQVAFAAPITACQGEGRVWNFFDDSCGTMKRAATCTWDFIDTATAVRLPAGIDRTRAKLVWCGSADDGHTVIAQYLNLAAGATTYPCDYDSKALPMQSACLTDVPALVSALNGKTSQVVVTACAGRS